MNNLWIKFKAFIAKVNDGGLWPLILPIGGLIFMLISAFFHLNNDYSRQCALSPFYMKILGLVLLGGSGFCIKCSLNEDYHINGLIWSLFAFTLLSLGLLSFANFFDATLLS